MGGSRQAESAQSFVTRGKIKAQKCLDSNGCSTSLFSQHLAGAGPGARGRGISEFKARVVYKFQDTQSYVETLSHPQDVRTARREVWIEVCPTDKAESVREGASGSVSIPHSSHSLGCGQHSMLWPQQRRPNSNILERAY